MRIVFILFNLLFAITPSLAQVSLSYYLPSGVSYDPSIPTPESFFGFQVGEWHLTPDQIHAYMKALDQASDRITMEPMGTTYEQRQIWLLTITSPENHRNIQDIRRQHLALSDPSTSGSVNVDRLPVVVWMGYSVHGNEPSGSNASVLVAYYLAAAQGAEIEQQLQETVILLNPSINPDGLNRFATWANMHKGKIPVADPASREHNEVWPGGRTNHYWFDLNRDWMPLQHPESRARLEKYYAWMPNILTDHHEMGTNATFFFQPGEPQRNHPLAPKRVHELTVAIAQYHAKALDQIGSLYYTQEGYDDYYVGKGSSYPDLVGCIGILFEQASSRGHVQESTNGNLTFPFTIRNQFTTSLSTLRAARELRKELLTHQREFFTSALNEAEKAPVKAYLFGSNSDAARNYHFIDILRRHQIDVYELAKQTRADGKLFEPGQAFLVPTNQKQYRLITAIFERRTQFEDSLFYDISSWTLPLAFNLPYAELKTAPRELFGARVASPRWPSGTIAGSKNAYAYAFEWKDYYAPRALYRLLKAGIKAKVAVKPFETQTVEGKRTFDYGTIVIPTGIQQDKADTVWRVLETAAREDGIRVFALTTGLSVSGLDVGSSNFVTLSLPTIALIVGPGVSATDIGEAWHLLDQRFGIETSLLETNALGRVNVDRYTVIVMASGMYASIDSAGRESLRRWVGNGGTLIAMENAVEWAIDNRLATGKLRRDEPSRRDTIVARRPYVTEERYTRALNTDGAIFEVQFDRTHPLLFGYEGDRMSIFRGTNVYLDPSRSPYATPMVYTATPLLSGYLHKQHEKLIRNSAAIVVSTYRNGKVILMTDNPNFRAFWYGTNRLFLNGIFLGSMIRPSSARAEE
jgi:hypothetical protein